MSDNYQEEVQLLRKLLRTESFRFVIITYNHYSLVTRLKKEMNTLFPDRKTVTVDAEKVDFSQLFETYKNLQSGILFVDNFEDIIKLRTNSLGEETPELAKDNERRRGITAGLNLRRDKLSKYPIALIVFISSATKELYTRTLMERMPDLWSFRSLVLELEIELALPRAVESELPPNRKTRGDLIENISDSLVEEIGRLEKLLRDTPEEELAYRATLYEQLTDKLSEVGYYDRAIVYLEESLENTLEEDKGIVFNKIGENASRQGNLQKALASFEKLLRLSEQRLISSPNDDRLKNNLAVSYSNLGRTHGLLGNEEKALEFFELNLKIRKELFDNHSQNFSAKNNLAISYCKLGEISISRSDYRQALIYFEKYKILIRELYEDDPQHLHAKNNLAVAYGKLGETYVLLGNLEKALEFLELDFEISNELYEFDSNDMNHKNNLAISYEKLGRVHDLLGNLEKAKMFFEHETNLFEELNAGYPQSVSYKNGLAISYCKQAQINVKNNNLLLAISFLEKAEQLWLELTKIAPNFPSFQRSLKGIRDEIAHLRLQS